LEWKGRGCRATRLRVSHAFHSRRMEPMLDEFRGVAEALEFGPARIPVVSNVSGVVGGGELSTSEYWVGHVREAVRFADGVGALEAAGVSRFLELGPDGVLCAMAHGCLGGEAQERALLAPVLRARRSEGEALIGLLAGAHADGVPVDWGSFFAGRESRRVGLPTYAFQREQFWVLPRTDAGDLSAAGLGAAEHPLLGAALPLAGDRGWAFTGSLSLAAYPWLADHMVFDTVLLAGTAFVELVLAAGGEVGCEVVEELTLEAPLVLAEGGAVQLQLTVGEPDEAGRRAVAVYSRAQDASAVGLEVQTEWTRHAGGVLAPAVVAAAGGGVEDGALEVFTGEAWPPAGAEAVEVEFLYDGLAEAGFGYGPVFQGVGAAWRRGEEVFVEVALDEQQEAGRFGVHPALFDAALHGLFLLDAGDGQEPGGLSLPFSWSGVRLHRSGAQSLRVRLAAADDGALSLTALDETGAPVVSVESLVGRTVDAGQLQSARRGTEDSLFRLEWAPVSAALADGASSTNGRVPGFAALEELQTAGVESRYADLTALGEAIEAGASAPDVVIVSALADTDTDTDTGSGDLAVAARGGVQRTLGLLQAWLGDERLADARLVLVTRGAVAAREGEAPDPVAASVLGLVRSAQSEHPGRFLLVDLEGGDTGVKDGGVKDGGAEDGGVEDGGAVGGGAEGLGGDGDGDGVPWGEVLAVDEPQVAVRDGALYAPRLARVAVGADEDSSSRLDPDGTVLITGGTGGLGALVARHLAGVHSVRHLLLVSRRGRGAEGADELVAELGELGADATVVACDVTSRGELAALIDSIPAERPLTGVVHAAGVLDDGVIETLDAEQVGRVMRPKVDAALYLHELTEDLGLSQFVLFSSAAGLLGGPGQGNYAAANAFLDALAQQRRARGLAGSSLAWGLWAGGMTGDLGDAGLARLGRLGMAALSDEQGLELFDAARALDRALLVPVRLDVAALRPLARVGVLPALLRGVVRVPARREQAGGGSLARRLAGVAEAEWDAVVLELVCSHVAAVLGHESAGAVDSRLAFKELGFDSLGAVELRNRLAQVTGLRLPATLVFDHPTPAAVAKFLRSQVGDVETPRPAIDTELDKIEAMLASITEGGEHERVNARLRSLVASMARTDEDVITSERIEAATAEEIFELIDTELGKA
jgi:NADP-dependent 3-hydroxy acid dehydrogenase YdfG/acyl carrier protein